MLPATLNVIMSLINWEIILVKSGISRHIFNIDFHANALVGAALLNADRRTDRRKVVSREREKNVGIDSWIDGQTDKVRKRVINVQ